MILRARMHFMVPQRDFVCFFLPFCGHGTNSSWRSYQSYLAPRRCLVENPGVLGQKTRVLRLKRRGIFLLGGRDPRVEKHGAPKFHQTIEWKLTNWPRSVSCWGYYIDTQVFFRGSPGNMRCLTWLNLKHDGVDIRFYIWLWRKIIEPPNGGATTKYDHFFVVCLVP